MAWWPWSRPTIHDDVPSPLLAPAGLCEVLAHERKRSERTGQPFTLVVFRARHAGSEAETLARLADILPKRLRAIDRVGRLDATSVAAVLPATPSLAAVLVAEDVCGRFDPAGTVYPLYEIFTFPAPPEDDDKGDPLERRVMRDLRELDATLTPIRSGGGAAGNKAADAPSTDAKPQAAERPDRAPRVHSMQRLFARPLPWWKRAIDVAGASAGLLLASPLLLAAMAAVKLTSKGPAIFSQYRTGLGGRPFRIYKLRTMCADAEAKQRALMALNEQDGPAFKIARDPRITPVGRLLRKTNLDELPQLWNVLKGDMSLVGPRPLPCHEAEQCTGWLSRRLDVTPGLTCIWQVQENRNSVTFDDWTRMDVRYIGSRSIKTDLALIWRTAGVVLARRSV
jgi:lipopolysaccharide/colanic/teichoic acid biosynthesis glycosyltransferase